MSSQITDAGTWPPDQGHAPLLLNRQRIGLLVLLFTLLASVYLLTYSARIESGDTRRYLDAVSSFADYGDFALDLSAWQFPPQAFDARLSYPLQSASVEPLQVILAAPLYLLARILPGFGLLQTVYLFNIIICAAAGCVLFVYALALGYGERTAALAALAFGVGTAIFPYSKSFFREPLVLLMLLLCALLIERLRAGGYRSLPLLIGVLLAVVGVLLAKASALLAFPALLVIALPDLKRINVGRAVTALVLMIALALGLFVVLGALDVFGERYNLLARLHLASSTYLATALQGYLLSVGGSVWGTSPMTLLALPGMALLIAQRRWRYPLAIVLLVLAFALGYAWLNGPNWFGGLSWPPRFLIPVLPFLILGALPIFERMARQPLWALLGAALLVYSLWVNLSGLLLPWTVYPTLLPPQAGGLIEWSGGLNDPRYLRWTLLPPQWSIIPLDPAWSVIHAPGMFAAYALLAAGAGACFASRALRGRLGRWIALLPLLLMVVTGVGLRLLYASDPRYLATDDTLAALLPILEDKTDPSDVILLDGPRYEPYFFNAGKLSGAGRVIALPLQPGEQVSPEQPPLVRSDNPAALLMTDTVRLIYNLAATRPRLWLLEDSGPDLPWSVRPVERFMDAHYYPIGSPIQTSPIIRLIEYSTVSAPDMFAYRQPEHLTDLVYANTIRLVGFDLPSGTNYAAGGVLPISLYWQTSAPISANETVGLYLRDASGAAIAQVDGQPGGGFFSTSGWQPGVPVWDNRALQLPDGLLAGDYQLWVKLYDFKADGSVEDQPVTAGDHVNASIGVLPVTLHIG